MSLYGADSKFIPFVPDEFLLVIEIENPVVQAGMGAQAQVKLAGMGPDSGKECDNQQH